MAVYNVALGALTERTTIKSAFIARSCLKNHEVGLVQKGDHWQLQTANLAREKHKRYMKKSNEDNLSIHEISTMQPKCAGWPATVGRCESDFGISVLHVQVALLFQCYIPGEGSRRLSEHILSSKLNPTQRIRCLRVLTRQNERSRLS